MTTPQNANPDLCSARQSADALLVELPGGRLRAIAYWMFWFWLALLLWLHGGDLANYLVDSETYYRVYRDPRLYRATMWTSAVLCILAVGFQAAGWRKRLFSRAAIGISIVIICYTIANLTFGIHKTCCG